MTATALSGGLLAGLLIATPALAQQGGAGGSGGFEAGGNGGGVGQAGGDSGYPIQSTPGGAGGATPGAAGSDGGSNVDLRGGGGGGGGADGDMATPIGGNGGAGGNGGNFGQSSVGGGGGGAGGNGLILAGSVTNAAVIRGGDGGRGGTAGNYVQPYDGPANGGSGGEGGAGIIASPGAAIANNSTGSISGGNGGTGGGGSQTPGVGAAGADGAGGEGIRGAGFNIQNAGSISGGLGGDGVTRAYALHVTGSAATLGLLAGGSITGGLQVDTGGVLAFEVNGTETLGNVISGDGSIAKIGTGTLILAGTNTYTGSTILSEGTLQIGDVSNISAGTIALNAGTLRTTFDGTLGNALSWDSGGTGSIAAAAGTTLSLTGTINAFGSAAVSFGNASDNGTVILANAQSYSGYTVVNGGTLQLDDLGGIGSSALVLNAGTLRTTIDGTLGNNLYWDGGATGTIAAATGTELILTGALNYGENTVVQFGSVADTGTIIASFSTGSTSGGSPKRFIVGGGIFKAGGGHISLSLGNFDAVQIDAGATLDIAAAQPTTTLNGLEGAGTLLNDGATTIINSGDFAGTISRTQNIVKGSAGTLILSGDNDYSGTTLVDQGVLQIGNGGTSGTLGSGDVTVSSGASLAFARSDDHTVSNLIAGNGSLEQAGPGILTLTGANTYAGGTVITGGLISFTGTGNFGGGNITLNGGGLQWGTGTATDISTRLNAIGSGGALFDTNGNDVTLSNTLSGSGGLTKLGTGTLTLSGSNSFGGPLTIVDGRLLQASAGALGGASIVLDGGTLDIANYDLEIGQARTITGSGTLTTSSVGGLSTRSGEAAVFGSAGGSIYSTVGILVTAGSTLTVLGDNQMNGIVVSGRLVIGETGAAGDASDTIFTIGSVISYADGVDNATTVLIASNTTQLEVLGTDVAGQSGDIVQDMPGRGFEKIGSGTLNMTGANAYTGTTLVSGGTLGFNDQAIRNSAAISIRNGAAIRLLEDITYSGTLTIQASGGTIDTGVYSLYQAEHVDFLGELTKTGSGRLTIGDNLNLNTGAGGINVLEGTLALATDPAAGTGTIKLADNTTLLNVNVSCGCTPLQVANAIQIAIGGTATIDTNSHDMVLSGNLTGGNLLFTDSTGAGRITLTGTNSYGDTRVGSFATLVVGDGINSGTIGAGSITVDADGMLAFDRSDDITLSNVIGGDGMLGQFGIGKLTLTADNSYTGGTLLLNPDGTIEVGIGGTTGSLGSGTITLAGSLIFNRSDDITIADQIIGDGSITKLGAGTLTLSGDNADTLNGSLAPYFGTISVQGGTLAVGQFGLGLSQLVELYGGTTLKALDNAYGGDVTILAGGATIDTGAFDMDLFGSVDFQGELTKTGSGTLYLDDFLEEGTGAGGINVLSGRLGLGSDFAAGTGTIKLADGTTLLSCGCSSIYVSNAIEIALAGSATIDGMDGDIIVEGAISGGDVRFVNSEPSPFFGTRIILDGANSYGSSLIGPNVALIVGDGTLGTGDVTFDAAPSDPNFPSALVFQNSTNYTYDGKIIGAGIVSIEASSSRRVTLTGSNTAAENFTGTVDVMRGRLEINGNFGDVVGNGATLLVDDAFGCGCGASLRTLGGTGTFHGSVTIGAGTLAPGNSPGTLTITGDLTLGADSILNYELGAPGTIGGANDLTNVGGDLRLDGTLNITAASAGYYRLFNYGGTRSGPGLTVGSISGGAGPGATVLTNIGGQVNLRLGGAQIIQYWDGADTTGASTATGGEGGNGTWDDSPTNWTAPTGYTINDAWQNQVGVFAGAAGGTVTVANEQAFEELRFETDGYLLRPANGTARLTTVGTGFSIVDVSAGVTADIGVVIQGSAGIDKAGDGTLILSAVNDYSGTTDVAAGTLRMGIDNAIKLSSALTVWAGATFDTTGFQTKVASLAGAGSVTLGANGRLEFGADNNSTAFSGTITGGDTTIAKQGTGTFTLSGSVALGTTTGRFDVGGGALTITNTGSLTASFLQTLGALNNAGTINAAVDSFGVFTNTGTVNGLVTNFNTLDNSSTIDGGFNNNGNATNSGTITGAVFNNGNLTSTGIINGDTTNNGTLLIQGQANGELVNSSSFTATLTGMLTGVTRYSGASGSMLNLAGFNTGVQGISGDGGIQLGSATLTLGGGISDQNFSGVISGSGGLTKSGTNTQTLSGANTYTGTTDVAAGTLRMGTDNVLFFRSALNVQAGATFDLAGFRASVDALSGAGDITLNNGRLDVGLNNASSSFSGTITGTGGTSTFTKNGSGTLTLSGSIAVGANPTLDAFVQVNGSGSLVITGSGSLSADLIQNFGTIQNSGTIDAGVLFQSFGFVTNASTGTITGTVQNFGGFENYGTMGALQSLSGAAVNHSSGVINGSVQTFAAFANTGIINGTLSNFGVALIENQVNGELANLQSGATVTLTGTTTGITNYNGAQGSLLDLAGFNTIVGALNGGGGDIQLGGATLTVDNSVIASSDFGGAIIGAGALTKTGSGEQILRGVNTYTGETRVNGGTLRIASSGSLAGDVLNTASFDNAGTVAGTLENSGTATNSGTIDQFVNNTAGTFTTTGVVNPLISGLALSNAAGATVNAEGQINGLVQNSGTFNVTGTLTGITRFNQFGTAALNLQDNDLAVGGLSGSGTVSLGSGRLTVGVGDLSSTYGGVISGSGGLTKTGTDLVTLGGVNTYTGQTLVSGGTLLLAGGGVIAGQVANNAVFQTAGTVNGGVINNGAFQSFGAINGGLTNNGNAQARGQLNGRVENQTGSITLTGTLTGNGAFVQTVGAQLDLAGFNASFGSLSGNGNVSLGSARLTLGSDNTDKSFAGTITGSGGITKVGDGTMTLTGASAYGGQTIINDGMLLLAQGSVIGGGGVVNGSLLAFDGTTDRSFGNAISGTGAVIKTGSNTLMLLGANSYEGGTAVLEGTVAFVGNQSLGTGTIHLAGATGLRNANGGSALTLTNDIDISAGTLATLSGVGGSSTTLSGAIADGNARFAVAGAGTTAFTLTGTNSYEHTQIGAGVSLTLAGSGTLGTGNTLLESGTASLTFANAANYTYGGQISGNGTILINTAPSAAITLTGSNFAGNDFTGTVTIDAGKLVLNGDFGDITGNTANMVINNGSLGGGGVFHGNIDMSGGTLNPGNSPGTLNIAGNLQLGAGTILNFELAQAGVVGSNVNDLVNVGGNLRLDGTLNVTALAGFGEGYYRLFNYGGTLTDNGLLFGGMPAGYTTSLLTNIGGQVNILFASSPQAVQYWDGGDQTGSSATNGGNGGAGVWNGTSTNWTAPTGYGVNDSWRGQVAVFGGPTGGTVTVQGTQAFQELRFQTTGYVLNGATATDGLSTTGGFSVIDVAGGATNATINAAISGAGGLTKTGNGTLTLGGTNSYAGVTTVSGGTLELAAGGSLAGGVVNDATFRNDGTVAGLVTNNASLTSTGTLNGGLANNGLALISGALNGAVSNSDTIMLMGGTTGIGAVTQSAGATFRLNSYDVSFGSLAGAGTVALESGATLTVGGDNSSTSFTGVLSGSGSLIKTGTGTMTLTGTNTYAGLTTVSAGTLAISATGSLAGLVQNDATFANAGTVSSSVTNNGTLTNSGTLGGWIYNNGSLTSTGTIDNSLENTGSASIAGALNGQVFNSGTVDVAGNVTGIVLLSQSASGSFRLNGFDTGVGRLEGAGTVALGSGTLTVGSANDPGIFTGTITGSGGLTKIGTGTLTLGGANSYAGLTMVSAGTLALTASGSLAGPVRNQAFFSNAGTVNGAVQNDATLVSTGNLAGGLINYGSAALAGTVGTGLSNNGTVTFTGTATVEGLQQGATGSFDLDGYDVSLGSVTGSGTIALGSGTLTLGSAGGNSSFAGVISGSGALTKTGTGTLTLTGANTYTGLTTVSGGALALGAGGTIAGNVRNDSLFNNAGTVAGLVTNSGTLASNGTLAGGLDNSGDTLLAGTVGAVANSGTIDLGGTASFGAVTQTAGGAFHLNDFNASLASLAGAGSVDLGNALLTLGGNNSSTSFGGAISGSGGLTKTGTGTFTLTGANSYSGLTTVSAGTLTLSATGSLAGTVRNDATLVSAGTIAGGLLNNGTASLQGQTGTGIVNNGTVSFTAATTVAALQQAAGGSTNLAGFGVSIGTLTGAGTIALGSGTLSIGAGNGNSAFAGAISGSGGLTKTGTGTLVLSGANTYAGITTISGGTLQIGSGGTTGSIAGTVVNNGVLVLNRSDAVTFANAMSGTGGFVQAGTGTTTLTGANSYTGGTLVASGRLRGDTAALQGAIRVDGALEFAQTGAGTYSGSISGAGLFEKSGTGELNLTGDSSTFTGATHVLAGRLAVNGLLSRSIVTVGNGGTLGGTGTVGGIVVQSGGTLAPGNSVGTFNVAGNVLFQAGSLFAVEVQASGADRVQATGSAQLNGTLQITNLGGTYSMNATYVLLHADSGVSGTFATANLGNFGAAFRPKLIYTANEVQLLLAPNQLSAVLGPGVPLSYNQASTIGRIDAAVLAGYDPTALSALYSLAPAAIPAALDSFSGEIYADATRASLEDERVVREAVIGRLAEAADAGLAGNGAWGQVIGSWGSVDGDGNAAGYDVDRTGMLMGLDGGAETEDGSWRAGVMGHYTRITVPAAGRGSRATIDRTGGGFYAGVSTGGWRIRAGASLALLDLKAKRGINIAGITGTARAKAHGTMLQTFAEISYRIDAGDGSFLEPYLVGSASRVQFGRFAETSGPVPLIVAAQKNALGVGELGLRGEAALGGGETGGIRLGGNIGLRTAFGDRTANPVIALAAMPDQGFNIHSAEIDRFAVAANLNLSIDVSEQVSLRVGYSGVQGAGMREHGGRASLSLRF